MTDTAIGHAELKKKTALSVLWSVIRVAWSTVATVVVFVFAPYYGDLVRDPKVAEILRWLAPLLPVSSLAVIHNARLAREFGHKNLAAQAIAASLLSGITAVA